MVDIPLEIPLTLLIVRWLLQGRDPSAAGVEVLHERFDRAVDGPEHGVVIGELLHGEVDVAVALLQLLELAGDPSWQYLYPLH